MCLLLIIGSSKEGGTSNLNTSRQHGFKDFFFVVETRGSSTPSIQTTTRGSEEPPLLKRLLSIIGNPRPRPNPTISSLGHFWRLSSRPAKGLNTRPGTWRHLSTTSTSPVTTPFLFVGSCCSVYHSLERVCSLPLKGISQMPIDSD